MASSGTDRKGGRTVEDDILLRPQLGDFGSTNFAQITQAVEPGAEAAVKEYERLKELSLDHDAYEEYRASRRLPAMEEPALDFVRIDDEGPLSARVIARARDCGFSTRITQRATPVPVRPGRLRTTWNPGQ